MSEIKKIGTHSGSFHCDEALACYMLRLTKEYKNAEIVRTRDTKVLETLPIIVDVGGEYDPARGRFDHHQRGFFQSFSPDHKTKLSSAGLIYKHFGKEIIQTITNCADSDVDVLFRKMYDSFIEALDGVDNGIHQYSGGFRNYVSTTDLSSRVGRLNPAWNEDNVNIDERFQKGMQLAGAEFEQVLSYFAKAWLPARALVKECLETRFEVDPSGEILTLKRHTVWPEHLLDLEQDLKISPSIKYVLYEDTSKQWRIQAVPIAPGSFTSRKALPECWRGLRDEELSKLAGIPGCVFAHASGFIGGHANYEGVLAMARASLKFEEHADEPDKGEPAAKKSKVDE